jgi:NADH dehydrogenase FAD-containing subunit
MYVSLQVKNAQKIVVIGGGAAGVELSGDIREDYKTKDVTLIHPREILVNDKVNESFQKTVKDRLKLLGVKTILGNEKNITEITCVSKCQLTNQIIYLINQSHLSNLAN